MIEKHWNTSVDIQINDENVQFRRPKLTIADQIQYMRDEKGIKFEIVSEE